MRDEDDLTVPNDNIGYSRSTVGTTLSSTSNTLSLTNSSLDIDDLNQIVVSNRSGSYPRYIDYDKMRLDIVKSVIKVLSIKREDLPRHVNDEDVLIKEISRARLSGEIDL